MYSFSIITPESTDWSAIEASQEHSSFFTRQWDTYLRRMRNRPMHIRVERDGQPIGYFFGCRRWLGIKMLFAPSVGTGTYAQGLCMTVTVSKQERVDIYKALFRWILDTHIADYVQVCDWQLRTDSDDWIDNWHEPFLDEAAIRYQPRYTYWIALQKPEEELWASLHYKSCRYAINKARKLGLHVRRVEREEDIDNFVRQHRDHILDVLRRKGDRGLPCQSEQNISALCHSLFPDHIAMLEVLGPDESGTEQSMSSAIFTLDNGVCSYFTSASYQQYMHYCPNELMVWEGLRLLNASGCTGLILGGMAQYKRKFAPRFAAVPVVVCTRFRFLTDARKTIKKIYWKAIHIFK